MKKPNVLVSVLNWNGKDKTVKCLRSLFNSSYQNFSVVVIDNASHDNSSETITTLFPQVKLIQNLKNLGFAAAQNQGINFALENGYEYIWILNNDTIIDPQALHLLVAQMDSDSTVGSVSPVLIESEFPDISGIQFCGCAINWEFQYFEKFKRLDDALVSQEKNPETFCLWGTALLIRTSILKRLGGFEEKLFAYFEDVDFCVRLIRAGFRSKIVPNAIVFHDGANDPAKRPPYYVYLNTRNKYFFWINHLPRIQRFSFTRHYVAGALLLVSSWHEINDRQKETATLFAIWDALLGRGGMWNEERIVPSWLPSLLLSHPYIWANFLRGNFYLLIRQALQYVFSRSK
jgi:GT2 family glycosyltransferase